MKKISSASVHSSVSPSAYVIDVKFSCDGLRTVSATSESNSLVVHEATSAQMQQIWRQDRAHSNRINGLVVCPDNNSIFFSCSDDGNLCGWDTRQPPSAGTPTPAFSVCPGAVARPYTGLNERSPVNCVTVAPWNSAALAVGVDSQVILMDLSNGQGKLVAQLSDVHTDDVTSLQFVDPTVLLSGSEDGLINEILVDQLPAVDSQQGEGAEADGGDDNEPDYVDNVLSDDFGVVKMGSFGPQSRYVYSLLGASQLSLWDRTDANRLMPSLDLLSTLSGAAGGAGWPVEYVADCSVDPTSSRVRILAGNYETGSLSLFSLLLPALLPATSIVAAAAPQSAAGAVVSVSHDAVLRPPSEPVFPPPCRAADWLADDRLVIGSEDGTITLFQRTSDTVGAAEAAATVTETGSKRFHPY